MVGVDIQPAPKGFYERGPQKPTPDETGEGLRGGEAMVTPTQGWPQRSNPIY